MIKEIVESYYNQKTQAIQVSFRMKDDSDDYIREDEFEIDIIEGMGYYVIEGLNDDEYPITYEEDTDDIILNDDYIDDDCSIDESELSNFLSEYYETNPKKIPPSELF
jgi:hypothetical protein